MLEDDLSPSDLLLNTDQKKNNLSRLLINESPLQVLPSLAVLIGLNEAIVLQQIHYWISNVLNKNVIDGRKWVYNTYEDWKKQFPFWSKSTIVRTIDSLENKKLIISGSFNKMSIDRTKWYTIDYEKLESFDIGNDKNSYFHLPKMSSPIYSNWVVPFIQNDNMHLLKMSNPITRDYIPEINTEINKEIIVRNTDFENEFEEFWNAYDSKLGKKKCEKTYCSILRDKGVNLHGVIMCSIDAQKKSRALAESLGIWQPCRKLPLTWLNGNCWEDEIKTQEQLNEERKRTVKQISNQPKPMSAVDKYHELNASIRDSAEREIERLDGELARIEREEANSR